MPWTDITRTEHNRTYSRYPSDMTDREWAVISALVPLARPGGRPRTTNMREVFNAILYMAGGGAAWRMLPKDFPPLSTVQGYFYRWRNDGTLSLMNFALVQKARELEGKEPCVSASATHITWKTPSFMRLLGDALQQGLMPAIAHTHPVGIAAFSGQDDKNERELARTAIVKGLPGLISLVINGTGTIAIRIWRDDGTADPVSRIFHVGLRLRIVDSFAPSTGADELLDRQSRLFGGGFDTEVKDLRIGIAGGGATGSAVLTLLMHLGIGRLLVIDKDILELTNLNRVHGSRRSDATDRLTKTAVHARTVAEADLGRRLVTIDDWAGAPSTWDALKSCDVIFGCTDDHAGRLWGGARV